MSVLLAAGLMVSFYAVLYLDHAPDSLIGRALSGYLVGIARLSGGLIRLVDPAVTVSGRFLQGAFPLEIALDCGALDVQAIFAAAVLAFPAPWRLRAWGVGLGLLLLTILNLFRIAILYVVGARLPAWFHTLHEEVFQIVIVVGACLLFALWADQVMRRRPKPVQGDLDPA